MALQEFLASVGRRWLQLQATWEGRLEAEIAGAFQAWVEPLSDVPNEGTLGVKTPELWQETQIRSLGG